MPKLGEPGHGEDEFTDLARYGWMGPTTVKRDGNDLARYGWVGPTTVVTIPCLNWVSQDTERMNGLTWQGMAGWDLPR